jgi:hypothetical protein
LASGAWQPVRALPLWAAQLLAVPIGTAVALVVMAAWVLMTPHFDMSFAPAWHVAVAGAMVILSGMLVQVSAHPLRGLSSQSIIGIWPSRFTPYTACLTTIRKQHLVAVSVLPFLVLTVLPLAFAAVTQISSGWLVFASCFAAWVFGPVLVLGLPTWWLPPKCMVAGRGFKAYWRPFS